MDTFVFVAILVGIVFFLNFISWASNIIEDSKRYRKLKLQLDNLESAKEEHRLKVENDKRDWVLRAKEWNLKIKRDKEEIEKIAKQKSMGFPWLAEAFAEYFSLKDGRFEKFLKTKKRPAYSSAEIVREVKLEKKELRKENKILSYRLNYFLKLFPWLEDLIAKSEDEEIPVQIGEKNDLEKKNVDGTREYLTSEEWKKLPSVQRNQLALDRYVQSRHKSKWAIGRDYEMYIGYLWEKDGYLIEYKGIIDGFDDLGRDIIAKKDDQFCIIQCKHWAQYKTIHEKHIFQLFGTVMEYWIKATESAGKCPSFEEFSKALRGKKIRPIFVTSTQVSFRAKAMARTLHIEIMENAPLGDFPRIKCNVNSDEYGLQTKIYHLPMDQQYDRTIIGNRSGDFFAFTVKEAESAGFRRAFRHKF